MNWFKRVFALQRFARMATSGTVALLVLFLSVMPVTGCTASEVNQVVTKIDAYLPTALSLLNEAITIYSTLTASSTSTSQVSVTLATVKTDLTNLQKPLADYLAASSGDAKTTAWSNIMALVDTATTDADALLQVAAVKNSDTHTTGVIVISSLDAAIHVLDAYVSSTQTSSVVQSKLAKRTVKLRTVAAHWSAQDKQNISSALGVPYPLLQDRAEALGY
jgi:hypothetical protein